MSLATGPVSSATHGYGRVIRMKPTAFGCALGQPWVTMWTVESQEMPLERPSPQRKGVHKVPQFVIQPEQRRNHGGVAVSQVSHDFRMARQSHSG